MLDQARYLTEDADVWSQNAWDHVPAPEDQHERIAASLARQHASPILESDKGKYNEKPARHWYVVAVVRDTNTSLI